MFCSIKLYLAWELQLFRVDFMLSIIRLYISFRRFILPIGYCHGFNVIGVIYKFILRLIVRFRNMFLECEFIYLTIILQIVSLL